MDCVVSGECGAGPFRGQWSENVFVTSVDESNGTEGDGISDDGLGASSTPPAWGRPSATSVTRSETAPAARRESVSFTPSDGGAVNSSCQSFRFSGVFG